MTHFTARSFWHRGVILVVAAAALGTACGDGSLSPVTGDSTADATSIEARDDVPAQDDEALTGAYAVAVTTAVYDSVNGTQLDIYQPVLGAAHPAFVLFHGGGWQLGDKSELPFPQLARHIAAQGYTVFSVNYRLVTGADGVAPYNPLPDANESNVFPIAVNDAQLAVRWVRAHAGTYRLDTAKICSMGFSAGAHLAAFLGTALTIYRGAGSDTSTTGQLPLVKPYVTCVVADSTPADLTEAIWAIDFPNDDDFRGMKDFINLENLSVNEPVYELASPMYYVSAASAPMYISGGSVDDKVRWGNQGYELWKLLFTQNVAATTYVYDGDHVFSGWTLGHGSPSALSPLVLSIVDSGVAFAVANAAAP